MRALWTLLKVFVGLAIAIPLSRTDRATIDALGKLRALATGAVVVSARSVADPRFIGNTTVTVR